MLSFCDLKIKEINYHLDWNLLIPVLQKIESLGYKWEIGTSNVSPYHYCKILKASQIIFIEAVSPIDTVYGAVVEFIKWYNKNK